MIEELPEEFEAEYNESGDVYNDGGAQGLLDDDELSPAEEGFMRGYEDDDF